MRMAFIKHSEVGFLIGKVRPIVSFAAGVSW